MVVGMITIRTCYGDADIPVELLGKGPRPGTAWVKARNSLQPFTKISHGGPYQDDTLVVALTVIRDIHVEREPGEGRDEEMAKGSNTLTPDRFLESTNEKRLAMRS